MAQLRTEQGRHHRGESSYQAKVGIQEWGGNSLCRDTEAVNQHSAFGWVIEQFHLDELKGKEEMGICDQG